MCAVYHRAVNRGISRPARRRLCGCPQALGLHFLPIMAGNVVATPNVLQRRLDCSTVGLGVEAAGMKAAAAGGIDRAGHVAWEDDALFLDGWVRAWHGREQCFCIGM